MASGSTQSLETAVCLGFIENDVLQATNAADRPLYDSRATCAASFAEAGEQTSLIEILVILRVTIQDVYPTSKDVVRR
jgi:hypothetical protein